LFALILLMLILNLDKIRNQTIKDLRETIQRRETTIDNLMNRLQAGDLRTFHSLNTDLNAAGVATPMARTDENELAQLRSLGHMTGLGEEIYDDEFGTTAAEFGIDLSGEAASAGDDKPNFP
jgi:hypothetical protein